MSNKEDTTREVIECRQAIESRLSDLHKKIIDNVGNRTVLEEVLERDLSDLNEMILHCDDLRVDPRKLTASISEYTRNLPLHTQPTPPRSLYQFEEDLRSSGGYGTFGPSGGNGIFNKPNK